MGDEYSKDYLEAKAILAGTTLTIPEMRHLEALQEMHDVRLIRIVNELDAIKRDILNLGE